MASEHPLPGRSRRWTGRLCEGATDFKQTRSVVKCERGVCVVQTTPTSALPSRLSNEKQDLSLLLSLLLLLTGHADITVLGSERRNTRKTVADVHIHACARCKHTHTHTVPLNGILPQHQYFPSPCFL